MSLGAQFRPQLLRVIKLPVVGDGICAASGLLFHGLMSADQVYDGQTGVGETGMFAQADAGIIGAAVSLHRGHVF